MGNGEKKDGGEYRGTEGQLVPVSQDNLPANPIEMLAVAVTQGTLDVESMKALMDLERQYRADKAKAQYAAAMVKFSGIKEIVAFNRHGTTAGKAKFGYADYPTTVSAVSPWMQKCGLSHAHRKDPPIIDNGKISLIMVYCRISHKGGHSEEFPFPAIPDERLEGKVSAVQLIQMAVTYAKRQSLCDGLGIATGEDGFDDDGNTVSPTQQSESITPRGDGSNATPQMIKSMKQAIKNKNWVDESMICSHFNVDSLEHIPASMVNDVLDLVRAQ